MFKISCEICGIKTCRADNKKRTFMAKFPLNEDRCKQWVKVTGKEDLVYVPIEKLHQLKYICGKHFRPIDFKRRKTQLKMNAVPSLYITSKPLTDEQLLGFPLHIAKHDLTMDHNYCKPIHPIATDETVSINLKRKISCSPIPSTSAVEILPCSPIPSTSAVEILPCSPKPSTSTGIDITPRKKKLLKKLETTKMKLNVLKKKIGQMGKLKSPLLKNLITATIRNQNRKSHGKRWTKSDKSLALAIYKKSPKTYRYLTHLFSMPSIKHSKQYYII